MRAATATMRDLERSQPGRAEQLMLTALQQQQSIISALQEEVTQLQLFKSTATRDLQVLKEEVARLRDGSGGGRSPSGIPTPPAVRQQGQLPLAHLETQGPPRGANDPGTPRPASCSPVSTSSASTSPFDTSSAAALRDTSSPTATADGASAASAASARSSDGTAPRPAREDREDELNDAARQRHAELQAAANRQQQHGSCVIEARPSPQLISLSLLTPRVEL